MTQTPRNSDVKDVANPAARIRAWWKFDTSAGDAIPDASGNGYTLIAVGAPAWAPDAEIAGSIELDGATQSLGTSQPVLRTDESFSVAAWIRLGRAAMGGKLALKAGEHALTAVSQDSPTHSAFYLGVREIERAQPGETTTKSLHWNFTISPVDGSETGVLEWQHAHAPTPLDDSALDKWLMLVGVCDIEKRTAQIYVPGSGESGSAYPPEAWSFWQADGGLQLGRGRWLGRNVDPWPGRVGPVRLYSGVLTAEDAQRLYSEDCRSKAAGVAR